MSCAPKKDIRRIYLFPPRFLRKTRIFSCPSSFFKFARKRYQRLSLLHSIRILLSVKFYTLAYRYREFMKDEVGTVTLDSLARHFGEYEPVDEVTFSILCNTMPDDPRITAIADFDFESNTLSICEHGDDWRTYDLKDVSTAVFKANRKSGLQITALVFPPAFSVGAHSTWYPISRAVEDDSGRKPAGACVKNVCISVSKEEIGETDLPAGSSASRRWLIAVSVARSGRVSPAVSMPA